MNYYSGRAHCTNAKKTIVNKHNNAASLVVVFLSHLQKSFALKTVYLLGSFLGRNAPII